MSQLWFLGLVCWQAGAETDSIKWLKASITIAACQDWVEQVAEVKMLGKKSISTSVLWRTKNWLHSCNNNCDFLLIIEVFIHLWLDIMVVLTCRLVHYFPWFNLWKLRKEEERLAVRVWLREVFNPMSLLPDCLRAQTWGHPGSCGF